MNITTNITTYSEAVLCFHLWVHNFTKPPGPLNPSRFHADSGQCETYHDSAVDISMCGLLLWVIMTNVNDLLVRPMPRTVLHYSLWHHLLSSHPPTPDAGEQPVAVVLRAPSSKYMRPSHSSCCVRCVVCVCVWWSGGEHEWVTHLSVSSPLPCSCMLFFLWMVCIIEGEMGFHKVTHSKPGGSACHLASEWGSVFVLKNQDSFKFTGG